MNPLVAELLKGLLPGVDPHSGSRLAPVGIAKLPADTVGAARVPAGVHLKFMGSASSVRIAVRLGGHTPVPSPECKEVFEVFVGDSPVGQVRLPTEGSDVEISLPPRPESAQVRIYLPETIALNIDSVVGTGGSVIPVPSRPRLVVQGDSIAQGWSVTTAGLAWPSQVAQRLDLELVNLGFAGSARGELVAATIVSESQADCVALAWGTNCWSSIPTDGREIAERMRLFLAVVRQGLPDVPLVVVSPIVRPGAESEPNRFGATLRELRGALEGAAADFAAAHGDANLVVVPGRELVPAELLVDGVHPGDEGHRVIADGLVPYMVQVTNR